MMSDIPSEQGVHIADYADDVAFFTGSHDITVATAKMQSQLRKFYSWTKQWGLSLNLTKTKCMLFTNMQTAAVPLSVDGCNLEFVKQYRYLGVVFDAPRLRWEPHIHSLKLKCMPIVNLLQSISNRHWGADRTILIKLYKILIRNRIDYAAAFYASAAPTNLSKLNIIQNNCLRIALGCRKTTPVSSMEVEANIPPLSIHHKEVMCKYYLRLIQLPLNPIVTELFSPNVSYVMPHRRTNLLISFVPHTRTILASLQIQIPRLLTSPLISPLPPWFNADDLFSVDFSPTTVSDISSEAAVQIFSDLVSFKYSGHTAIYTDGSHISTPSYSTSAAFAIPSKGVILSWKLRPNVQVIESELFAIREALCWSQTNLLQSENIVIFTDSQSAICLIRDRQPASYLNLVFDVQTRIMSLMPSHEVRIQYVPGHRGILGNEAADRAARDAHLLRYQTLTPSSREELAKLVHDGIQASWNQSWKVEVNTSGKGCFITLIRDGVGNWPWASHSNRAIETALTRLRTGHAGVRAHLARFGLVNSPLCSCGSPETIQHLLLQCPLHQHARDNLTNLLSRLDIPMTLKNILGGGPYPGVIQNLIIDAVGAFLITLGVLHIL
jgi:ribonuclease HI